MKNGFVIDGLTPATLADKLVQVGEGHNVLFALAQRLQQLFCVEYLQYDARIGQVTRVRKSLAEQEAFCGSLSASVPGARETLTIKVDATAVQEAIDKEVKSIGLLGEIAQHSVLPGQGGVMDRAERAHRVASIAFFERKNDPMRYRTACLDLAAITLSALTQHDMESAHDQRG